MKKLFFMAVMAVAAVGLNACKPDEPVKLSLEGLDFESTEVELTVGEVYVLKVTVTPSDAEGYSLLWSSSDEAVAAVNDGTVTALSAGEADITVSSGDISAVCKVAVKENIPPREEVVLEIGTVALSAAEAELTVSAASGEFMPEDTLRIKVTNTFNKEDVQEFETVISSEKDFVETISGLIPAHVVYSIEAALSTPQGKMSTVSSEYEHVWDEEGVVYDCEGNVYTSVVVENQEWLVENLHVGMLNDGTPVEFLMGTDEWLAATETPAWCYYGNNADNGDKYGYLYNFSAAGSDRLCPVGWRTPTHEDWQNLGIAVGGTLYSDEWGDYFSMIGIYLKATEGWEDGKNGQDTFGLSFLPGGCRNALDGTFNLAGSTAYMWSSSPVADSQAGEINVWYITNWNLSNIRVTGTGGFSVRCVRDAR